ncbi:MAG TPA: response regulator [Candidatus Saccharimonadales bacterium]|nr:response regulator [Candidatus Saccharimonadales bacterium]
MPKLMLVEDDNNLREIYEARLQAEGYQIISAKDGEEALVLAKAEKPDLIIADVMMPKISGFEMLDILRNTEGLKQVKIVMLTALGQNDDQKLANRLGADRYLVKSQVTLEDIVKVAHELLSDNQPATTATPTDDPSNSSGTNAETPVVAVTPSPTPLASPEVTPPSNPVDGQPASQSSAAKSDDVISGSTGLNPPPIANDAIPVDNSSMSTSSVSESINMPVHEEPNTSQSITTPKNTFESKPPAIKDDASIEGHIEDFVAGASEDPGAIPNTAPSIGKPTSATDGSSVTSSKTTPAEDSPSTVANNDYNLVADAAQKLTDSTDKSGSTSGFDDGTEGAEPVTTTDDHRTKKVIQPLNQDNKKDIDTLLAVEEARDAATAPSAPAEPVVVSDKPNEQSTSTSSQNQIITPAKGYTSSGTEVSPDKPTVFTPGDTSDPNNIAL